MFYIASSTYQPATKPLQKKGLFYYKELLTDIIFFVEDNKYTIKKGFTTDLASVPRFFWRLFPPFGRDEIAFIIHDWLYVHKDYISVSKRQADYIMRELQYQTGASFLRRWLMWLAVATFGWIFWLGPTDESKVQLSYRSSG